MDYVERVNPFDDFSGVRRMTAKPLEFPSQGRRGRFRAKYFPCIEAINGYADTGNSSMTCDHAETTDLRSQKAACDVAFTTYAEVESYLAACSSGCRNLRSERD